ncbi:MAG: hypothetical protein IT376_22505 [Polyangiaceae bacterium]|nr:hypothetical protein [Polyangiaceae bacterium]
MISRTFVRVAALLAGLGALSVAGRSLAAGEEERARNLTRDAMEQDYLATNFKAAAAKLETALKLCGKDACSKELVARIYRSLGTVRAAGLGQQEAAVEAFKEMLRLEPGLTPDSNYVTEEVQKAYDAAKAAMAPAATPTPVVVEKPIGVLKEEPWAEQATFHPVPIFVELPEGVEAARVVVRYKAPGQEWQELQLKPQEGGYGGLTPCSAVEKPGELLYFVTAFDSNLDRVASAGSAQAPRKVVLAKAITGRQPALPGGVPPSECPRPEEVLSCETNDDCPGNQVCKELACVEASEVETPPEDPGTKPRQHHFSVWFGPDVYFVSSADDACSQQAQKDGTQTCYFRDGTQYLRDPAEGDGSVVGGAALGTLRAMVSYEYVLKQRFVFGARLGYALLGPPAHKGSAFQPFHGEARFAFHIIPDSYARKGVRPYAFVGGGVGGAAARVNTTVAENDNGNRQAFKLDVYQQGGSAFVGGGFGVGYAVSTQLAMLLEVGARQYLPDSALAVAPTLGFSYGL